MPGRSLSASPTSTSRAPTVCLERETAVSPGRRPFCHPKLRFNTVAGLPYAYSTRDRCSPRFPTTKVTPYRDSKGRSPLAAGGVSSPPSPHLPPSRPTDASPAPRPHERLFMRVRLLPAALVARGSGIRLPGARPLTRSSAYARCQGALPSRSVGIDQAVLEKRGALQIRTAAGRHHRHEPRHRLPERAVQRMEQPVLQLAAKQGLASLFPAVRPVRHPGHVFYRRGRLPDLPAPDAANPLAPLADRTLCRPLAGRTGILPPALRKRPHRQPGPAYQ